MVLANEEDVCDIFQVAWCSDAETAGGDEGNRSTTACADSYPGCAWFTPERLPNAVGWSALKSGHNLETLWLLRYHLATEAMRRGINVLMSDLDGACGAQGPGVSLSIRPAPLPQCSLIPAVRLINPPRRLALGARADPAPPRHAQW